MALADPVSPPAAVRRGEGASLALGLALGLLAVGIGAWFRPWGLLLLLLPAAVALALRSRQVAAGAMVGAALPLAAQGFWGSVPWVAVGALALLAGGVATALLAPADDRPARLAPAVVAVIGVLSGVFAGFVLLSSLFLVGYLPLVLVLSAAAWAGRREVLPWLVLGAAVMPWFIGIDNRGGPGVRCGSDADSQWCRELADPVPFLVAAAALTLIGIAALVVARRRRG